MIDVAMEYLKTGIKNKVELIRYIQWLNIDRDAKGLDISYFSEVVNLLLGYYDKLDISFVDCNRITTTESITISRKDMKWEFDTIHDIPIRSIRVGNDECGISFLLYKHGLIKQSIEYHCKPYYSGTRGYSSKLIYKIDDNKHNLKYKANKVLSQKESESLHDKRLRDWKDELEKFLSSNNIIHHFTGHNLIIFGDELKKLNQLTNNAFYFRNVSDNELVGISVIFGVDNIDFITNNSWNKNIIEKMGKCKIMLH